MGPYKKWDHLWGTNPEAQSGLVLVPVNTRDNTDRVPNEYGQNINRTPSIHRQQNDAKSTETSGNIDRKSTENRQTFLEVEF